MKSQAIRSVGHTGITVSNLTQILKMFREVFGLQVSRPVRASGPMVETVTGVARAEVDIAFVRCPEHVIELLCFVKPERSNPPPRLATCDPGFFHLAFKIDDIERVLESLRAADFEAVGAIQTFVDGPAAGTRVVYARNPDGVVLELIQEAPGVQFENLFLDAVRR